MLKNIFKKCCIYGQAWFNEKYFRFGKNLLVILGSFSAKYELALLCPPGIFVPIQTLSTSQQ